MPKQNAYFDSTTPDVLFKNVYTSNEQQFLEFVEEYESLDNHRD